MKLSTHQKKVLAVILALEKAHGRKYWARFSIGQVVEAGGFHQTIQLGTIAILKRAGLIQSERSSWPENVRDLVKCGCSMFDWGLTAKGRVIAQQIKVRWDEESLENVQIGMCEARGCIDLDEVERGERIRKRWEQDKEWIRKRWE